MVVCGSGVANWLPPRWPQYILQKASNGKPAKLTDAAALHFETGWQSSGWPKTKTKTPNTIILSRSGLRPGYGYGFRLRLAVFFFFFSPFYGRKGR